MKSVSETRLRIAVFIFDEIFEAMACREDIDMLKSLGADIHIITDKGKVLDYAPTTIP